MKVGQMKSDHLGSLRSEEQRHGEFSGFYFSCIYPRLGARESRSQEMSKLQKRKAPVNV